MKTLKQVEVIPVFVTYVPSKELLEFGKIYISKEYSGCMHLCLCGCGTQCYLPLKHGEWILTEHGSNTISISPSIQQRFECQSHYIITKNKANFV